MSFGNVRKDSFPLMFKARDVGIQKVNNMLQIPLILNLWTLVLMLMLTLMIRLLANLSETVRGLPR
jgi:hypothetical protein